MHFDGLAAGIHLKQASRLPQDNGDIDRLGYAMVLPDSLARMRCNLNQSLGISAHAFQCFQRFLTARLTWIDHSYCGTNINRQCGERLADIVEDSN